MTFEDNFKYITFMSEKDQEPKLDDEIDEALDQGTEILEEEAQAAETFETEMMKWRDTAMRTAAEYDNYRKRMAKDKEEILRYANQRLFEELLPIIDNFDMGMMAASADTSSMIYIGMNMVKKKLDEFLTSNGVTAIEPKPGDMFDVHREEALQSEPSDEPAGTILRVIRKGYMLKDRLMRPANVVVATHPEENTDDAAEVKEDAEA